MRTLITKINDSCTNTNIAGLCTITPPSTNSISIGNYDHNTISGYSNIISSGSSNIIGGVDNYAYGNIVIGTLATPLNDNIISGSYSFPATYSTSVSIPNYYSNEQMEKLEKRIKYLETKLEKVMELITDNKVMLNISI